MLNVISSYSIGAQIRCMDKDFLANFLTQEMLNL